MASTPSKTLLEGKGFSCEADFSCHAARRGAPTTARGRVRCAVAISINKCFSFVWDKVRVGVGAD